jgi:hypothetical protein
MEKATTRTVSSHDDESPGDDKPAEERYEYE